MRLYPSYLLATALLALPGCKRGDTKNHGQRATAELPPLVGLSKVAPLSVSGFGDSVVALPVGITRPAPVLVAVLGIGDSPEEQCTTWQSIVGTRAFVLCPRGAKHMVVDAPEADDEGASTPEDETTGVDKPAIDAAVISHQEGFYPVDLGSLEREVSGGLTALKARYGTHVADGNVVYAGFSRGAFLGASLAMRAPARFRRLVLIEGGHTPWEVDKTAAYARAGGSRVLFACGQPNCVDDAQKAASALRSAKIEARIVHGEGEGHGYRKQVKDELARSFDWVVEGDPEWQL
jgi:predicted esterase